MNTESTQDKPQDTVHSSAYNPFPEPQTIPSGWDVSELLSSPQSASSQQARFTLSEVNRERRNEGEAPVTK